MSNKIVHLIGQLRRGGAERQLIHLAGELAAHGWPQAVVSFGGGDAWNQRLEALGVSLYEIPRHPIKPWRLWQLLRIVRRERPAILQTWSPHVAQYAYWTRWQGSAATLYGVRIDLTVAVGTGEPLSKIPFLNPLIHADCAVSNSQSALDSIPPARDNTSAQRGYSQHCKTSWASERHRAGSHASHPRRRIADPTQGIRLPASRGRHSCRRT